MARLVIKPVAVTAPADAECRKAALRSLVRLLARLEVERIFLEMRGNAASETPGCISAAGVNTPDGSR